MPLRNYGVLKGRPIGKLRGTGQRPHYQIRMIDDDTDYRIAVNVKSKLAPSELLYLIDENFVHPVTESLPGLSLGFTELHRAPNSGALDYIRGNLFDSTKMKPLPHNIPGPDNDLNEKIEAFVAQAMSNEDALIYAFGERWGPESRRDKYFGFRPGNGIHDIHMNQGNHRSFQHTDGVWQDGALLIHFPQIGEPDDFNFHPEKWVAVFLAFQSQCFHTDDSTGSMIPEACPHLGGGGGNGGGGGGNGGGDEQPQGDGNIRIVAALVNPPGDDPGLETVTVINRTPASIDLDGWAIADKNKKRTVLDGPVLKPGEATAIRLDGSGAQLSNKGGIISILNPGGIKIHGVSYTKRQAKKQGWTLVF